MVLRYSRGTLLPPVRTSRPRRRDIYHALRTAILDGVLRPSERLPSTRHAAADYGVSRGVLEEAFGQLMEEGFLERAVGRGTFIADAVSRLAPRPKTNAAKPPASKLSDRGRVLAANAACREPRVLRPFNGGVADVAEFPWKVWQRLQGRAARELGHDALTFAEPCGLPILRAAISRYLAQFRGIRCDPDQVVIFNSSQQAINGLAVLLLDRADAVWLEDPCYLGARAAFALAGATIVPIPVDDEGMRVHLGVRRAPRARLAYVTPSHQYPTGAAMSIDRRIALLEWSARADAWVIEDDYDGEFRYEGQPLMSLHSLDPDARVLHVGTLNKSMFVSLRLAYAVVPHDLVLPLTNLRTQLDGFTPPVGQMTMSLFMDEGHFSAHLRRMRAAYGAKRDALIDGLRPLAERGWTWSTNPAGMHLLVRHARGSYVRSVAAASGLDLALLSSYRDVSASDDGLLLRFGALPTAAIRAGCSRLLNAARTVK